MSDLRMTPPFHVDPSGVSVRDANEQHICDLRAWGHLTGRGGLGLSDSEAWEIQKARAKFICDTMNAWVAAKEGKQ